MFTAFARAIQTLLDVLLPRKDRTLRVEEYASEDIPVSPVTHDMCGRSITTLMLYRDKPVEDLIRALKYDASEHAARHLADVLAEFLRAEIAENKAFSTKAVSLVAIPLHRARLRERSFNQIEKVLQALPDEFKDGTLARVKPALVRTRATPQQTRLSRRERLANVAGAFALDDYSVIGTHIFLIDDVTTTGATLTEAAKPLQGETVTLLALAHA